MHRLCAARRRPQRIVTAASDKDIEDAQMRMDAIAHFKRTGIRPVEVGDSSVDRYMRWAREGEEDYGNPFIGLIRPLGRKPRRDDEPLSEMEELMSAHVDRYCRDENAGTQEVAYGVFLAECEELGFADPPSRETFRRRIKARPLEHTRKGRTGEKSGYSVEGPVPDKGITTPPHGDRVFEVGAIDHWTVPISLVCSRTGADLGSPILTLLIDAYSTMPLGFALGFDAPSRARLNAVISDCVRRHNRVPDSDVFDQANEGHSLDYRKLWPAYGHRTRRATRLGPALWAADRAGIQHVEDPRHCRGSGQFGVDREARSLPFPLPPAFTTCEADALRVSRHRGTGTL